MSRRRARRNPDFPVLPVAIGTVAGIAVGGAAVYFWNKSHPVAASGALPFGMQLNALDFQGVKRGLVGVAMPKAADQKGTTGVPTTNPVSKPTGRPPSDWAPHPGSWVVYAGTSNANAGLFWGRAYFVTSLPGEYAAGSNMVRLTTPALVGGACTSWDVPANMLMPLALNIGSRVLVVDRSAFWQCVPTPTAQAWAREMGTFSSAFPQPYTVGTVENMYATPTTVIPGGWMAPPGMCLVRWDHPSEAGGEARSWIAASFLGPVGYTNAVHNDTVFGTPVGSGS